MIEYGRHTPSPGRVAPCWLSPVPAEKPACRPLRSVAGPGPAAPHQEKASAPTDGRSMTRTPETAASLCCSGRGRYKRHSLKHT